jgi:hypothetical protein
MRSLPRKIADLWFSANSDNRLFYTIASRRMRRSAPGESRSARRIRRRQKW